MSEDGSMRNEYLAAVQAKQQEVEADLRVRHAAFASVSASAPARAAVAMARASDAYGSYEAPAAAAAATVVEQSSAVDVRIRGWWRWKTVLVPPNAYVVHTRRGHAEPLHLGLGTSFRFNPNTDSFLVVPAAMQTILINAHCICRELQGLLVQGYVQWIIGDFGTAYRKLDFTDAVDPMRVVNVQLREQAEAAIKDKVATMGIDDVLSDKQPIIEELTARLRHVAEGAGKGRKSNGSRGGNGISDISDDDEDGGGLGLRIVTVQIKEAVVSSARLWENLQKPFRAERARVARLAELAAESVGEARELDHGKVRETARLESESELAGLRAGQEAVRFDREQAERGRRQQKEQEGARREAAEQSETLRQSIELRVAEAAERARAAAATATHEKAALATAAELATVRLADEIEREERAARARLALEAMRQAAANAQTQAELAFAAERQRIDNDVSASHLQARLIAGLPALAAELPKPKELRSVVIGDHVNGHGAAGLSSLVAEVLAVVDGFRGKNGHKPAE